MKSLEKVRSSRALVEPSHWLEKAIDEADDALKAIESGDAQAPHDLITLARTELNHLYADVSDEQVSNAASALESLAKAISGGYTMRVSGAARSLRTARRGPLPARMSG